MESLALGRVAENGPRRTAVNVQAASRSVLAASRSVLAPSRSVLAASRSVLAASRSVLTTEKGFERRRRIDRIMHGVLILGPAIKTTQEQIPGTMLIIQ